MSPAAEVGGNSLRALADATELGLPALAALVTGTQEGVTIVDAERRWVYVNPAARRVFGRSLEEMRGRDFLDDVLPGERPVMLQRFREQLAGLPSEFSTVVVTAHGAEREIVSSTFAIEIGGSRHGVAIFRDVTGPRTASRAAAALARSAGEMLGGSTPNELLSGISRQAVENTRALACGISTLDEDMRFAEAGGFGPIFGRPPEPGETVSAGWRAMADARGEVMLEQMTAGAVIIGEPPGNPVVLPEARALWEATPTVQPYARTLIGMDWQAGVFLPMAWQNRVFGMLAVYLPTGLVGPDEAELAFYAALADHAAVAVVNGRLAARADETAALRERARMARDLHDSVSQALFSMTMHARAAQVSLVAAGVDEDSALARSVGELAQLTRGAMAEMRALIFELRPGALAEEGLVAALRKQAAALTAREQVAFTVDGPDEALALAAATEEHLYRIVTEALHNVVKHAQAVQAAVSVNLDAGLLTVLIADDGVGFDDTRSMPGHLGLSTMRERAALIGAELTITSTPGTGTNVRLTCPLPPPDR